jgi:hypothetical protein
MGQISLVEDDEKKIHLALRRVQESSGGTGRRLARLDGVVGLLLLRPRT